MPSWKKPTDEQIERAISLIARPEFARDFFDRLENPEWIEPLRARGYFNHPPARILEDEGRTITLHRWPISRYLARVAESAPEYAAVIHRALLSIPDTDNDSVHEDVIISATRLPGKLAADIASKESNWIRGRDLLFGLVANRVPDLIKHLLAEGQKKAAFALLRSILALDAETQAEDVTAKVDAYEYESVIDETLLPLVGSDPVESVRLFSKLLSFALDKKRGVDDAPHDYSYIWHAHLDRDDNPGDSIEGILTTAVRNASQEAVRLNPALLAELLVFLLGQRWIIFRRIALFLLAVHPTIVPEQARNEALNRNNFDEYMLRREYDALVHAVLCRLPSTDRAIYFDWVATGPDLADNRFIDDKATYARHWRRDRLRAAAECIPDHLRSIADNLPAYDLDEEEEIARVTAGWMESPFTAQELEALPVAQVIERLERWEPTRHDLTARVELGRELRKTVAGRVGEFVAAAEAFRPLHPTYVRSLIEGIEEAVRAGTAIDWTSTLRFCGWAVLETRTVTNFGDGMTDADFSWTRGASVRLIETALRAPESSRLPVNHASDAWEIIRPITDDPDPPRDAPLPLNTDPATQALNCNRGQALHATVQYALWLRQVLEPERFREHASIASVEQVLTEHLSDTEAPAILSIYGQYFPWLLKALPEWTKAQRDRIFPIENERVWNAAWPAYLVFCAPYNDVFRAIEDKYLYASTNASRLYPEWNSRKPERGLIEHVAVFFGRGVIPEDGALFQQTLSSASSELRAHMVWFVNNLLSNDKSLEARSTITRFQALWDLHIAPDAERSGHADDLGTFGWYGLSEAIPVLWFLERLITVLHLAKSIAGSDVVVHRIARAAPDYPGLAAEALALLLHARTDDAEPYGWRDEIAIVLDHALRSGDAAAERTARDIANTLGRMGYKDFRNYLPK